MESQKNKSRIKVFALTLLVLASLPFVAADSYQLWCVPAGESVNLPVLCNPAMPPRQGPVNLCMHLQDNGKICPSSPNVCNNLGLSCSSDSETELDQTPPVLTVTIPTDNAVYNSRSVNFLLNSNEISSLQYQDNIEGGNWKNLCANCNQYTQSRTLSEGLNDITFRATDGSGNAVLVNRVFSIDSRAPRIGTVSPTDGLASGTFEVEFEEDNPTSLIIFYGNLGSGQRQMEIDIGSCTSAGNRKACSVEIDLADYDGEMIDYHIQLMDIAGNIDNSDVYSLQVDNSGPVIEDFNYSILGKKVTFHLEINEPSFDSVKYIDHFDRNPREKNLCSALVNDVCHKQVSFNDGEHEVEVIVRDDAGNSLSETITFFIDSKKPKISSTEPNSDFGSGTFAVNFKEDNPTNVVLYYGLHNENLVELDIENDCSEENDKKTCTTNRDLTDYDGQEISYHFEITDLGAQTVSSNVKMFKVDMTAPIIDSLTYTMEGTKANIVIDVTEQNLDEITYINNDENRPRVKRFCSSLNAQVVCSKKISLVVGQNSIDIQVIDDAGNAIAQNIIITR